MKQEELWKTGEVVTLAVRNGVYQRLNGFYSILIAMIDEYRTEGLGDHKNRSISVMMGCSVCQKRRFFSLFFFFFFVSLFFSSFSSFLFFSFLTTKYNKQ